MWKKTIKRKKNKKKKTSSKYSTTQQERILLPPQGAEAAHAVLAHWLSKKLLTRSHYERLRSTIEPVSSKQVLKYLSNSSETSKESSTRRATKETSSSSVSKEALKIEILSSRVEFLLKRLDELEERKALTSRRSRYEESCARRFLDRCQDRGVESINFEPLRMLERPVEICRRCLNVLTPITTVRCLVMSSDMRFELES